VTHSPGIPSGAASLEWGERSWDQAAAELALEGSSGATNGTRRSPRTIRIRRIGTLAPGMKAAGRVGLPAFLETGVERNVALYERMGFVVTGVIDEPGLPNGWCMRRDPDLLR
jgi:hypothetical protein